MGIPYQRRGFSEVTSSTESSHIWPITISKWLLLPAMVDMAMVTEETIPMVQLGMQVKGTVKKLIIDSVYLNLTS
jgi:hypothetical protein